MTIDVYTATGSKKGTATLPKGLFEAPINKGLIQQAVVRQQSNRRDAIAHSKARGEISGSTRKLFRQKGTGRARRGSIRSATLRGGNKAFGPRSNANFYKDMPKKMRTAALLACLSFQAKEKRIIGLEGYGEAVKTSDAQKLLEKLPVDIGRKIVFVLPEKHRGLELSVRNIPGVKTLLVNYLNPEDVLGAHTLVFLVDALKKAEDIWGGKKSAAGSTAKATNTDAKEPQEADKAKEKAAPMKKPAAKKKTSPSKS